MSLWQPTAQQERWMTVVSRLGLVQESADRFELCGDWRTASTLARCLFFVLGASITGLMTGILSLLHIPADFLVSGLIAVAVAEWLIVQGRFFRSGLEEGMEITGLLLIVSHAADHWHDSTGTLPALLAGILLLIAGLRLLNPLVVTGAALTFSMALYLGVPQAQGFPAAAASAASCLCGVVAIAALFVGRFSFSRPSHDKMFDWLVIAMPIAGYSWFESTASSWSEGPSTMGTGWLHYTPPLALAAFGGWALLTGLRRRCHAPLLAFLGCVACIAYDLRKLSGLALEYRLIAGGAVVLLVTLVVDRYFRVPRRGITSARIASSGPRLDLLELAGTAVLAPHTPPTERTEFKGDGGQFGGGGASGQF